jgi:O-antigen/teichoic acid export membrane protein
MDAIMMAKTSTKGSFHLFWGVAASSLISALGVIVLANLLTPSEYGLYSIAFYLPTLVALFRDWGMNFSMVKYIAQYKKEDNIDGVRAVLVYGLVFEIISGAILSLIVFLSADFLSTSIFNRPELGSLMRIASLTIFFGGVSAASLSVFMGHERMGFNSVIMVFQSVARSLVSPLLVFLGFRTFGAVWGTTVSIIVAAVVGVTVIFVSFSRHLRPYGKANMGGLTTLRVLWKFGFPLSLASILGGFLAQFFSFMMAIYSSNVLIGNYQVAINFSVILAFFSGPISAVLFPAFSKLNSADESETLKTVFRFSVKYTAFILVPVTAALMTLSYPLVNTLFSGKYEYAPFFLVLYSISSLLAGFGSISVNNFINGQGATTVTLKLTLSTLIVGIPAALVFIPAFQITGVIIGSLLAGIPNLVLGLWWIKKHFSVSVDWPSSLKIFASSGLAVAATSFFLFAPFGTEEWVRLLGGAVIFSLVYFGSAASLRTLSTTDLHHLKDMASELGPISKLVIAALNTMGKVSR